MSGLLAAARDRLFPLGVPLAWRQLAAERKRFLAAVAGVTFAVTLMLFQMGIYVAIFEKVVYPHRALRGDLVLTSRDYLNLYSNGLFTRRRLEQALAVEGVESVAPLWVGSATMRNPVTRQNMRICVFGILPSRNPFALPEVERSLGVLSTTEDVLFDRRGLKEYGPIARLLAERGPVETEIGDRRVVIRGLFSMGGTISSGGHVLAGEEAYFRLVPAHPRNMINVGLVRLRPGVDAALAAERLRAALPRDVTVFTHEAFVAEEKRYWNERSPLAFVFLGTMLVAMTVGAVIVYQVLYTDVSDHIHEYATLKAIGAGDRFFLSLVLQQAVILMACGFVPGTLATALLSAVARSKAVMPAYLTAGNVSLVLVLAFLMCALAGVLALRRLRNADPADVF
ncbi:MAG TPA: ABC transporter permease DevC [Thermoanaerobaculia bacterium]|nr:ABC transporter permease DevC [Thermoanaerobaculia bacterium]